MDVLLLRLLIVIIIGGLIGIERELKSKSAGFRTIMMICLGSFLFTTFSKYISPQTPDRIASNIVTGIGFLGAGVIFKNNNRVNGLTTAATIWISAALGMGVATGQYLFVSISAATVFGLLHFLARMENKIDTITQTKTYSITMSSQENILSNYEALFNQFHFKFKRQLISKQDDDIVVSWMLIGAEKDHTRFIELLLKEEKVKKFEVV